MKNAKIHILWDSSQLWGIMAWRALRLMGASPKFILAREITQCGLMRKQPALLLAPGGSARQKALALGPEGLRAIRDWVEQGGSYLGFCGGAGLALSPKSPDAGLGLCPWQRKSYPDRLYHLVSGKLLADAAGKLLEFPVWWPGRFAEDKTDEIEILARYQAPGPDLWLADMPLFEAPVEILKQWQKEQGFNAALCFTPGQPLIIAGNYGAGRYILSYVHLETPDSGDANGYLASILSSLGICQISSVVPAWNLGAWQLNPAFGPELGTALELLQNVMTLAEQLGFFFKRTPWLWGWRRGAPGMACNNLLACLVELAQMELRAVAHWHSKKEELSRLMAIFALQGQDWLWNWRLAETLNADRQKKALLEKQRDEIFGHPMLGGGLMARLLTTLEEMIYLNQADTGTE